MQIILKDCIGEHIDSRGQNRWFSGVGIITVHSSLGGAAVLRWNLRSIGQGKFKHVACAGGDVYMCVTHHIHRRHVTHVNQSSDWLCRFHSQFIIQELINVLILCHLILMINRT